jgi:hypothetical protein
MGSSIARVSGGDVRVTLRFLGCSPLSLDGQLSRLPDVADSARRT